MSNTTPKVTVQELLKHCSKHAVRNNEDQSLISDRLTTGDPKKIGDAGWLVHSKAVDDIEKGRSFGQVLKHLYPVTKPSFFVSKIFYPPCDEYEGYVKTPLDEALNQIKSDIDAGRYLAPELIGIESVGLLNIVKNILAGIDLSDQHTLLRFLLTYYSNDFLNKSIKELEPVKACYVKLIQQANLAKNSSDREGAKEALKEIHKYVDVKYSKSKAVPAYLYLEGMRKYLLEIAKYMRQEYFKWYRLNGEMPPAYISDYDKKLYHPDEEPSSDRTLKREKAAYVGFVEGEIAKALGYSHGRYRKLLAEEKRIICNPQAYISDKKYSHLLVKVSVKVSESRCIDDPEKDKTVSQA